MACLSRVQFRISFLRLLLLSAIVSSKLVVPVCSLAGEPVTFDVPSILSVHELVAQGTHTASASQKTIEVIVPVTAEIVADDFGNISAFRFDVFWNRNPFPICDYGPKTQTFSEIDGTIAIEKVTDKHSTFGLNVTGGYQNLINGTGKAEVGDHEAAKLHYAEIPQHEVVLASGTIRRGTGAFFRLHPSRLETLEGGRDLVLAFQVPRSWRGGVLQVECTASGTSKVLAWTEPFEYRRAFIVPVYLDTDDEAHESAMEFVRREQSLRRSWQQHRDETSTKSNPFSAVLLSSSVRKNGMENLPSDWVHHLIQLNDSPLEKYRSQLPHDLEVAARDFVQSRTELLKLSR